MSAKTSSTTTMSPLGWFMMGDISQKSPDKQVLKEQLITSARPSGWQGTIQGWTGFCRASHQK